MSRLLNLAVCLFVVTSASGCCLMGCGGGYSPYGGGCSPCQTGACGAAAPGYPSAGMYNPNIPATAYAAPVNGAYGPQMVQVDQLRTSKTSPDVRLSFPVGSAVSGRLQPHPSGEDMVQGSSRKVVVYALAAVRPRGACWSVFSVATC